jgi:hypothetical protein
MSELMAIISQAIFEALGEKTKYNKLCINFWNEKSAVLIKRKRHIYDICIYGR